MFLTYQHGDVRITDFRCADFSIPLSRGGATGMSVGRGVFSRQEHTPPPLSRGESRKAWLLSCSYDPAPRTSHFDPRTSHPAPRTPPPLLINLSILFILLNY